MGMREEFETAAKVKWPNICLLRINRPGSPVDGQYELNALEAAWWAWGASRASLVVELPTAADFASSDDASFILEKCLESLKTAGLRIDV